MIALVQHSAIQNAIVLCAPLILFSATHWTLWSMRRIIRQRYKPIPRNNFHASVSIITAVYNEDPKIFQQALHSWKRNMPDEIIAVIDESDANCIHSFQEFAKTNQQAHLIITSQPGKRNALWQGYQRSRSEIIAFVDSDTIWGEDILPDLLAPFIDPDIGAVGCRLSVLKCETLVERMYQMHIERRFTDEFQFLSSAGNVATCIWGRTALYRRKVLEETMNGLTTERFAGHLCVSGDDMYLTRTAQELGWKIVFQSTAIISTPASSNFTNLWLQHVRWARNAWISNIKTMTNSCGFQQGIALPLHIAYKSLELFTSIGPVYVVSLLAARHLQIALGVITLGLAGCMVRVAPSLQKRPRDFLLVPAYLLYEQCISIITIYAFFSVNTHEWITRWSEKKPQAIQETPSVLSMLFPFLGTAGVILSLSALTHGYLWLIVR